jgi:hypothetical protein
MNGTRNLVRVAACYLLTLTALIPKASPCSLIEGYFYQVTRLRGMVVGVGEGDYRHTIRSLRQQAVAGGMKLSLYAYTLSLKLPSDTRPIRFTKTDKDGKFDFGTLPSGRYALFVEAPWGTEQFDVEITQLKQTTESVMIDVSPIDPDCKGGQEFIITSK